MRKSLSDCFAIGVEIRLLTDALIHLVEEGEVCPSLRPRLRVLLSALTFTRRSRTISETTKALRELGPFGTYTGVHLLQKQFAQRAECIAAVKLMLSLLGSTSKSKKRSAAALATIPLFDALERKAFSCASGRLKLCQKAPV